MSVFLIGGSFEPGTAPGLLKGFHTEAAARAGGRPRVAVLLLDRGRHDEYLPVYQAALAALDADVLPVRLAVGTPLSAEAATSLAEADGILVGGGWAPGYHETLTAGESAPGPAIRRSVLAGTPYAGFSAGAMVAGETALLGGYLSAGREVCEEGCSEDLDDLTVAPGLGLVPFTCDVHITAAGTLGRALELVGAGHVDSAVGLDEDTCLTVPPGGRAEDGVVTGAGSVWTIRAGTAGDAVVRRWSA